MVVRLIAVSVCALLLTANSLSGQPPQQPQAMPEWLQGSTVNFGFMVTCGTSIGLWARQPLASI